MKENIKKPTLFQSLIPIFFLIVVLWYSITRLEVDPHIPLLLSAAVAAIVALLIGTKWETIEDGIYKGIMLAMPAIVILMIVGTLIGSWIAGGVVPTMIYYGLQILSPSIFLVAACIITTIVAIFIGSSWSTAATIGIALIGIGEGLDIPAAMTAGAVVSGAYVGDKMSPLSDTTNLASGTTGDVNLFQHIKHMLYVTIPAYVISLVLFGILGIRFAGGDLDTSRITEITSTLSSHFTINPFMLIPLVLVLVLIGFKVKPIPALFGGTIIGGLFAIVFQGGDLFGVIDAMHYGFVMDSGVEVVDDLLSAGGLHGMMWTISLIFVALSLGGILEKARFLEVILENILKIAKSVASLSIITHFTALFVNVVTADQYLAIVLTARMYRDAYKQKGSHPKNLSRAVESSATVTSPLIPWNTCGAYMYGALGVNPFAFLPYAFFNILAFVISMIYGITGFTMEKWKGQPPAN
ncbi:Na+/H+ antiporter NhaC [Proteinivorax hydrogeniformans]|uniref:Na+/H+ antiporter NhaC n=1 Tax=Proteinivorax hydrogeniformans TaxID=1826727 RepID=A0AAU8HVL0_9FIRM